MFKYEITPLLLENLKKITIEIHELNRNKFSNIVLHELEVEAMAQSAHSSTSIEGNPLPLTEVKKILKQHPSKLRETEKEVINYNNALVWLKSTIQEKKFTLDLKLICKLHQLVTAGLMSKSKSGKIRNEPVFVNDPKLRKTIYWPPDHSDAESLLIELIQYINSLKNKIDPILLAGIFHRQFVIIHPFIDGNGRTVRLATKALLANMGMDTFHLFSFENYYNRNVTTYFQNVGVIGNYYDIKNKNSFTSWLEYFSAGVLDELFRVRNILEKRTDVIPKKVNPSEQLSEDQQKIINYIKKHGFIRDQDYAKLTQRAKATRSLDFKKLLSLNLIERKSRGPSTFYVIKE